VLKPPGGGSNNIFGLTEQQSIESNENHPPSQTVTITGIGLY